MTTRTTNAELEALVHRLNVATKSPLTYFIGTTRQTSIGHYRLDSAYGGVSVVRTCNISGGVSHSLGMYGHVPKRECAAALRGAVAMAEDSSYADHQARQRAERYAALHDGLSDMIEGGRLSESDIPDDYQWLVNALASIG